ncbi:glycosyltransferase [Planococcus sp. ANT_H30]|uniref:glycosyltransferase n=1 Tax=Planococcus sp. ANT_H30 TaxID=2597347 RepID=UPI0011EDB0FF|nr:glycosyltransferase [Planococcus sp. ANT_H30]KAA0958754.1 glycosyltransferase [Planococcus sp. ANT_H30]
MKDIKFSIIIVSLNAGGDLERTVESVLNQDYSGYEIIVKDGLSSDGSTQRLPVNNRISIYYEKDLGIYDAMNQAIQYVGGEYVIFLNCGDTFYSETTLSDTAREISKNIGAKIYYGDNFTGNRNVILQAPRKMTNYICFTKILCHQSTFYEKNFLQKRLFDTKYKIAADAHFYISAFKLKNFNLKYIPVVVSYYQGGGFSETISNKKRGLLEHKQILKEVFSRKEYFLSRLLQMIMLYPIKQWLSTQLWFEKPYNRIANIVYTLKNQYSIR